ncbi:MAG: hypothetical protein MUE52_15120 [Tabrizicola sp.]|jgi:hypothetical protein|nr:hypothetical protein [Tabrizicola sp.]
MSAFFRLCLVVAFCGLLQACQTGLPGTTGGQGDEVTANAVAGDPIEVTALDEPSAEAVPAATAAGAEGAAPAQAAGPEPAAATEDAPEPAPVPEAGPTEAVPEVELPPEAEVAPGEVKSEAQLACEKRKGRWVAVGTGAIRSCVFPTRDSGKQCTRGSDCEEACLARSMTCAPFKPLWGCNEILQDNGVRVTQCIE